ncbi:MAG: tRNA lysidine(34) synthetase TilS [Alicyclobacillus herbarius]|uniref:tRNA lysidine(34) synthetase TilS n=1 Tax=Alicyclobacillus herbarius TaxID=122960 RepID=UPI0023569A65|nr:tRNA lysidine(34) synthetase TilS [Alicyclobacillus herbarius]MCL6633497.1 tRNA lysidine(34) synthetase TilS [Alicyclobacillus herbarius]
MAKVDPEHIRQHLCGWLENGQGPLVAAVSGGVDSMVLLHALHSVAERYGRRVVAVHVHHGLRAAADLDQQLVEATCKDWGVPCVVRRVDLKAMPKPLRRGVEADARRLRYQALTEAARQVGAQQVFLAHHADDQLETILWRLLRGTSLTGIGGMRPRRVREGMEWLRPFLQLEKTCLYAYAEREQVPFREDESNRSTEYTRNYLRQEILPRLRQLEPQAARMAARFAEVVQEEDAWLEAEAQRVLAQCAWEKDGVATLDMPAFLSLARPLQRRIVKILLYCLAPNDWSLTHIDAVLQLARAQSPSARVTLAGGFAAWREYERLYIGPRAAGTSREGSASLREGSAFLREGSAQVAGEAPEPQIWRLAEGTCLTWADGPSRWRFTCRTWTPEMGRITPDAWTLYLPWLPSVTMRRPRPGDRMRLFGLSGRRKLQDVFVDAKVPRRMRETWPVVCVGEEIVWVPGLRRAGTHLLETESQRGWVITCTPSHPVTLHTVDSGFPDTH